ncbi:MAG: DUF2330 domain-containing protein [Polyangiaceae bacterium]|nr:DUF2330 domain-containing protein [Polyangiaceae bacterium]NUQ74584.1 DUF2330 domain-containing protein [Polyangiaceae bacterium]
MRHIKTLLFALPLAFASLSLADARDASACGGCFVTQSESTQVTGHRMILSVSNEKTTLWDQIKYQGNPASFGWVLPIKGQVDIGLSSDALFETLEVLTEVVISSPSISCLPPGCFGAPTAGADDGQGTGGGGGVTVIAQEVVGPYDTVQLSSADSQALKNWLAANSYSIPADVAPVIDSYVAEGFDFLAIKLLPGQGIDSMRPVRITSQGASASLPLRMVAAGTGAITPISLWIVGEGRYEPTNFPTFEIDPANLIWNWDSSSSNYKDLRTEGFEATQGKAWLYEAAEPASTYQIEYPLKDLVDFNPKESGYGDADGMNADVELAEDLAALYGSIDPNSLWLMRLHAELPRSALATDLEIGASKDQSSVVRFFQATQTVGTAPECPPPPPGCEDPSDPENNSWSGFWDEEDPANANSGGCAIGGGVGSSAILGGLALSLGLGLARRRRNRSVKR